MNKRLVVVLALGGALSACRSPEPEPPPADHPMEAPAPWARSPAMTPEPVPAPTKPAEPAKPAPDAPKSAAAPAKPSPVVATPTTTVEKPAPVPSAPESKRAMDAAGQNWSMHTGDVGFAFDVDAATKRAAEGNRVLMLYFTTPTCGACRELAGTAFKDARVVAKAKSFEPVLVDLRQAGGLVEKYGVAVTPTIVYVAPGGKAVAITIDVVSADEALADMDSALAATARPAEPK